MLKEKEQQRKEEELAKQKFSLDKDKFESMLKVGKMKLIGQAGSSLVEESKARKAPSFMTSCISKVKTTTEVSVTPMATSPLMNLDKTTETAASMLPSVPDIVPS